MRGRRGPDDAGLVCAGSGTRRSRDPATWVKAAKRAAVENLAAGRTCAGTEVDDVIRAADHVVIVLDDHQRISLVAQTMQDTRSSVLNFARMKAEAGLVEHVECVDQAGAEGLGQAYPLQLAGRQAACGAVERQVIEPDLRQVAESAVDLGQNRRDAGWRRKSSRSRRKARASRIVSADNAAMSRPSILTARASGRSRAPRHAGHVCIAAIGSRTRAHFACMLGLRVLEKRLSVP